MPHSLAEELAGLPTDERNKLLAALSDEELLRLRYDWKFWARPAQIAPRASGPAG